MITKTIKFDEDIINNIELVAKKLNEKTGVDIYDFSNVVRVAINQYLNTNEIKEILNLDDDLLHMSETSLNKDWLKPEEDAAWANL